MPNLPSNDSDSQDNDEPNFPSPVPKNRAPEHDTHLAHHWQHLIDSRALASFKHTISHLHRPTSTAPPPPSTQLNPLTYDTQVLHDRLAHLHGPCQHESSFADRNSRNRYFHPHWPGLQRGESPFTMLEAAAPTPLIIFMHHCTKQMRCGHCGCEDPSIAATRWRRKFFLIRLWQRSSRAAVAARRRFWGLDLQRPGPEEFAASLGDVRKVQSARKAEVESLVLLRAGDDGWL